MIHQCEVLRRIYELLVLRSVDLCEALSGIDELLVIVVVVLGDHASHLLH